MENACAQDWRGGLETDVQRQLIFRYKVKKNDRYKAHDRVEANPLKQISAAEPRTPRLCRFCGVHKSNVLGW